MNKAEFREWSELLSYIQEKIIDNQVLTHNMIEEINILLQYVNIGMGLSEEKLDYADLLELFKQCQGIIDDSIKNNKYISGNDKLKDACKCIRTYTDMIFGEPKEYYVKEYYDKPASYSTNVSINVPSEVHKAYMEKMEEVKKENAENYRAFTLTGSFSTYLLAVANGLISYKKVGNQIWQVAKGGFVGNSDFG